MGKIDSRIEYARITYLRILERLKTLPTGKDMVNFPGDRRSGMPLRKTAVSFTGDETAVCLSTWLLLTPSKAHARSVSEAFFLSGIPSLSTHPCDELFPGRQSLQSLRMCFMKKRGIACRIRRIKNG